MIKLDKYKQAIVNEYRSSNKNIFITATAGAGKTFTLCELAKITSPIKNSIFLAFNKSIAKELENKLPRNIRACTLHSCGLSALNKTFNFNFSISDSKNFMFAQEKLNFKGVHPKRIPSLIMKICKLYNLMRFNLVEDDIDLLMNLGERYGEDVDEDIARRTIEMKRLNDKISEKYFHNNSSGKIMIDYTDMLYYAYKYIDDNDFNKYNVVMLDEVQDLNPLQFELVKKCKTSRGRLISVGDEKQSIYSFMGSNLDSLQAIKTAPNTISMPLSITYRCAEKIVEEANRVFPGGIEAAPGAQKGIVMRGGYNTAIDGDYIICRNNAPLVDAFIHLLKKGRKCFIMGKDFGDELVDLIDSVENVFDLDDKLFKLHEKLANKGIKSPTKTEVYDKLNEKVNVILSLYEFFGDLDIVRKQIYNIFVEQPARGIVLSTIHKSKGLEANRVFFLQPDLLPSPFATTELSQYAEKCLEFVAITRAKTELIYC